MNILIGEIINYLTEEISSERDARYKLVKWFKREPDKDLELELSLDIPQKKERIDNYWLHLTDLREAIQELKQIKISYQKTQDFFKNMQKGNKKGFNHKSILYDVKYLLERNERNLAIEHAKEHLEFVKKWKSERTYYREKRKLKDIGISNL